MKTRSRLGQAMVEMALVLPIFILIIIGIFDFGRAMHVWATLNHQCVQAARAGTKRIHPLIARNTFSPNTHTPRTEVEAVFWKYRSPMMAETEYVDPIVFSGVGEATQTVAISASYRLNLITPLLGALVGDSERSGSLTIHASAQEEKE